MQYQSEVIVLQDADASGNDYAARLSAQGFRVHACCSVSALARLRHGCDIRGVLVVGDAQPVGHVVGRIRALNTTMPVVVVRAGADVALRVQALQAGADACYASDVAAVELAAALRAASRLRVAAPFEFTPITQHDPAAHDQAERDPTSHVQPEHDATEHVQAKHDATEHDPTAHGATELDPTSHDATAHAPKAFDWTSVLHRGAVVDNPRGWRLMDGGCTLVSPVDERLRLTASERVLMQQLIGRVGRPLHRDDLAEAGWPSHAGMGANKPRSVDVLISRLRRKAERQGMALPLMAVRRWGYMFLGDVAAPPMRDS
ncbi:winged helix-turn-helix domain-containing protein [Alcaligenaceae bacterium C4P045]|nr:winged helix-turn-helix domain-containing protein [Alcaligenaceae bacterium C4P045]